MENDMIKLELRAKPLQFTMEERTTFTISIAATNKGDKVIDPELYRTKLFVNDKESKVWSLAIGNGKRDPKWFSLPPGETITLEWSSMGQSLFPILGEYILVLCFGNQKLEPIRVQVLA